MPSWTDTSADELKVFLQEAEGLLELLDEDIVRLEQEATNGDLLQEIFRAAHTLKGSSGMLGFQEMAQLTHAMEDLLDRVRKGSLAVTAELVDALLMSLDGLKVLKNDLAGGQETTLQVDPIISALHAAAEAGAAEAGEDDTPTLTLDGLVLGDAEIAARLDAAVNSGVPLLRVSAEIDSESEWAAVRCFQVLNELSSSGELIVSVPTQQQIEQEQAGHTLDAVVATQRQPDELRPAIEAVADVISVAIAPWDGPSEEAAATQPASAAAQPAARPAAPDGGAKIDSLSQSVRVDVEVLDELMNLVGELVIDRTRVAQITRVLSSRYKEDGEVRSLGETSTHIIKVVDELHESMMQVRMLPVGVLFSKFPRLVRDLSRGMGKKVSLVVDGEDTEIDRTVIEEIKDPLVHLIRNAIDHGVETVAERTAAGKPETAVVRLSAQHAQGRIVITIEDDGRGIDEQAILDAAVRKGAISAEAAERLSSAEVLELIFAPGLSTAEKTTEVSGRGVGMDIVRRNIESLNGRVEVTTRPGEGSTFALHLPLTLATFRGLLVESAGTVYAIPLNYVQETVRPDGAALRTVTGQQVVNLRGTVMSLLRLDDQLRQNGTASNVAEADRCFLVVVRGSDSDADRPVAIAVDALIDQQEVVVKSLSGYLGRARGIAGASILGDGQVVLILDIPVLIKAAQQQAAVDAVESERRAS
jgi:two-component system chemotaxis sensor kinase CheA